ncbi:hypothetical protein COLO4_35675 [Corchorus olitorius]|uniref:Uncharacterized protein n=1 Tax=Corchorus olitorius TaxID=93759 RepID=A0A1R3GE33_9ROSI|nr:hypothetical protein COLO4_35675 [Corchorus olitorius]
MDNGKRVMPFTGSSSQIATELISENVVVAEGQSLGRVKDVETSGERLA